VAEKRKGSKALANWESSRPSHPDSDDEGKMPLRQEKRVDQGGAGFTTGKAAGVASGENILKAPGRATQGKGRRLI